MSQVISEIAKVVAPLKFLELETQEVPAFGANRYDGRPVFAATKIPTKILIVDNIIKNGSDGYTINYINPENWKKTYAIVPNDFLASILPPEKYAELEKKYIDYVLSHLDEVCQFNSYCGTDPEIFVEDGEGNLLPAFTFLGSKSKPTVDLEVGGYYGGNKTYWDGFQAEFETKPNSCFCGVADSIQAGLNTVLRAARKLNPKAKLSYKTVFDIPPQMMLEGKPEHIQFGCMPSFNAYGMIGLNKSGNEVSFRPAGGHIHLQLDGSLKNKEIIEKMVKAMDAILGVACVSLFANFDDPRRRELYGLAGEYRMPPHGMEYRTLSNAWLIHPVIAHMVFDLGRAAAMFGAKDLLKYWKCDEAETIRIINSCDVEAARKVMETNKELLKKLIQIRYDFNFKNHKHLYNIEPSLLTDYSYNTFMNGLESIIEKPDDISNNWCLDGIWVGHSDGPSKNVSKVFQAGAEKKKI